MYGSSISNSVVLLFVCLYYEKKWKVFFSLIFHWKIVEIIFKPQRPQLEFLFHHLPYDFKQVIFKFLLALISIISKREVKPMPQGGFLQGLNERVHVNHLLFFHTFKDLRTEAETQTTWDNTN